jgi:hypothetical protein
MAATSLLDVVDLNKSCEEARGSFLPSKLVDPDYLDGRPRAIAQMLAGMFASCVLDIRHLDYGGGNGALSRALFAAGWNSTSYDPFVDGPLSTGMGRFNLVTSFEVFEHVPDVNILISTLSSLVEEDGMVLVSTLLSDGIFARNQRVQWWYASPRNGHISLSSRRSLELPGEKEMFKLASRSANLHAYWRDIPSWAADVFKPA